MMSLDPTTPGLRNLALFADLEDGKLEDFQRIFQHASFAPGARLMTQGHVADSIFFLENGTVEVAISLPGGGEQRISTLGPGSVIGEMALLDEAGTRTATVRALTATTGYLVERQDCRALLTQSRSGSFMIQRRLTLSLCQRLRSLLTTVMSFYRSHTAPTLLPEVEDRRPSGLVHDKELLSEYRKILPQLPFFQHFLADEIEWVLTHVTVLALPRGRVLFQQGTPGHASYILVRGAVELVNSLTPYYTLAVLGPGRVCGHLALIDDAPYEATAIVRSNAVLLELSRPSFHQLFTTSTRPAAKFQNALLQSLLMLQARIDNHLARMISQASIRAQRSL